MDLLERYLQAIGKYLPEETRDDTLAELRENLLAQMEANEEQLARPLTEDETADILKSHGKPELVALRYLPQRSLIGPTIFPFYLFTLRKLLPLVVLVYAVAQGAALLLSGADGHLARHIVVAVVRLAPVLLVFAASVTLAFVLVEFVISHGGLKDTLNEWNPKELPAVKAEAAGEKPKSLAKRVVDLCSHCLWMAYVLWVPWHPFWIIGPGVFYFDALGVTLSPTWHTFYILLITLLSVQLAMKLLAFVPAAAPSLKPLKLATDLLGIAALGWMAWSTIYFVAAGPSADVHQIATVNYWLTIAFRIAVFFAVIGLVKDGWKHIKPMQRYAF